MVFFMVFFPRSKAEHVDTIIRKIEFGMVSGQVNGARVTNSLRARQYASNARGTGFPK
jgi:hypothetical protein